MLGMHLQHNDLLSLAVASISLLSLTAQALPISQRHARSNAATTGVHDEGVNIYGGIYRSSSCPSQVPSRIIDQLKRVVMSEPHPMFLISEMAELLHQERYNTLNFGDCTLNQEALDATIASVSRTIKGYLNSGVPSEGDVGCPPSYAITYHPDRYPRYLVQVECRSRSSEILPRNEVQCSGSSDSNRGRVCKPYQLGDLIYLTTNPPASILCSRISDTAWHKCRATSVGTGCKYGDPE